MSSILKALKKIERRKAETQLPTWPYRIDNRESVGRHANRSRRLGKILGILIFVCAVTLAAKLYYGSRSASESMPQRTDLSVKTAPPVVPTAVPEEKPAAVTPRAETLRPMAVPERLPTEANVKPDVKQAPSQPTVDPEAFPDTADTALDDTALDDSSPGDFGNAPIEVSQTAPPDNAGLTLQALVWAEQPEGRFVVINGSITREGGTINGSVVVRIDPDYVTIRSGGTTWRLKYMQ